MVRVWEAPPEGAKLASVNGIRVRPDGTATIEGAIQQFLFHAETQTRLVLVPSAAPSRSGFPHSASPPPPDPSHKKRPT
eukprot:392143-Amphidinium_carterae.1